MKDEVLEGKSTSLWPVESTVKTDKMAHRFLSSQKEVEAEARLTKSVQINTEHRENKNLMRSKHQQSEDLPNTDCLSLLVDKHGNSSIDRNSLLKGPYKAYDNSVHNREVKRFLDDADISRYNIDMAESNVLLQMCDLSKKSLEIQADRATVSSSDFPLPSTTLSSRTANFKNELRNLVQDYFEHSRKNLVFIYSLFDLAEKLQAHGLSPLGIKVAEASYTMLLATDGQQSSEVRLIIPRHNIIEKLPAEYNDHCAGHEMEMLNDLEACVDAGYLADIDEVISIDFTLRPKRVYVFRTDLSKQRMRGVTHDQSKATVLLSLCSSNFSDLSFLLSLCSSNTVENMSATSIRTNSKPRTKHQKKRVSKKDRKLGVDRGDSSSNDSVPTVELKYDNTLCQ